jgi:hypothetical protein
MFATGNIDGPEGKGQRCATDPAWCAHAAGKQEWKENGNYLTQAELHALDKASGIRISPVPAGRILNAD